VAAAGVYSPRNAADRVISRYIDIPKAELLYCGAGNVPEEALKAGK
jgi:hypothetical protein